MLKTLNTRKASEFFGHMAIFEALPRSADVMAVEHGILLVLSPAHFRQTILQEPAISCEIFRALPSFIRHLDEEAMEAAVRRESSALSMGERS